MYIYISESLWKNSTMESIFFSVSEQLVELHIYVQWISILVLSDWYDCKNLGNASSPKPPGWMPIACGFLMKVKVEIQGRLKHVPWSSWWRWKKSQVISDPSILPKFQEHPMAKKYPEIHLGETFGELFWPHPASDFGQLCIGRSAISILDQQLFLVPLIGGRYHIIPPIGSTYHLYTTYIWNLFQIKLP